MHRGVFRDALVMCFPVSRFANCGARHMCEATGRDSRNTGGTTVAALRWHPIFSKGMRFPSGTWPRLIGIAAYGTKGLA